jgi:hypothetical protein
VRRLSVAVGATGHQVSPAPAHGGHRARGACRGRARRAQEKEGGGVERAGLASASGPDGRRRPVKERKLFSKFYFQINFKQ